MTKEAKCMIAEQVGEFIIGMGIGTCLIKIVLPKIDGNVNKVVVYTAGVLAGFPIGHAYAKSFYKICDLNLGTDLVKMFEL